LIFCIVHAKLLLENIGVLVEMEQFLVSLGNSPDYVVF